MFFVASLDRSTHVRLALVGWPVDDVWIRVRPLKLKGCLVFKRLSRLELIDELLFLSFHASDFLLVHHLLIRLPLEFLLNLGPDAVLFLNVVEIPLVRSLLLLILNHHVHLDCLVALSLLLLLNPATDRFLFELRLVSLASRVVD